MDVDTFYTTWHQETVDQADSFAEYLRDHGIDAAAVNNEVTIPMTHPAESATVWHLRTTWRMYWKHKMAEILPVFTKSRN